MISEAALRRLENNAQRYTTTSVPVERADLLDAIQTIRRFDASTGRRSLDAITRRKADKYDRLVAVLTDLKDEL